MGPSRQDFRIDDENWRNALEILERSSHLPPADRRKFVAAATDDPSLIELLHELLDGESLPEHSAPHRKRELGPGDQIGRYRIIGKLGAGGMGQVYSAWDGELDRQVALKFLSGELTDPRTGVDRLLREARAASALHHRNIVTIHEVLHSGEDTAIVMEYLEGTSLRSLCGTPLPAGRLIRLGHQVAVALSAAHGKGLIHRDIKPENVMVDSDDYAKVVDFGMARRITTRTSSTLHHAGTINYFSPEQARGEGATAASDIFSLGVVLYELACGTHPFRGDTPLETLHAIVNVDPASPSAFSSTLPRELNRLILAMLSKEPRLRPAASDVVEQLSRVLPERTGGMRRRLARILAATLAAAAIASAVLWIRQPEQRSMPFRELTSTDVENRVTAAAISPDGLQFAFADVAGAIFLRSIESRRTRPLRHPDGVIPERLSWFPNSSALLAVGRAVSEDAPSAWIVRVDDAEPQLVQKQVDGASLSPDGERVALTSADSREVWLKDLKAGLPARKLLQAGENEIFQVVVWSADGSHLILQRRKQLLRQPAEANSDDFEPRFHRTYESIDIATGQAVYRHENVFMRSAAVQPDGRMLFLWPKINGYSSNVWQMKTDPSTGRIQEPPRTLTEYREMALAGVSASTDGKRIMAVHYQAHPDVYVAEFDPRAKKILSTRRVTMDRAHDYPHGFTPDGRTIFFESNRNGTFDIFRQSVDERYAEFVAGSPGREEYNPTVTPDGKWVLFASEEVNTRKERRIERVPIQGGEAEIVPTGGFDFFDCAQPGGRRCVVRTTENQEYVFHELDPVLGKGRELLRLPFTPGLMGDWSISADGTEVAIPNHDIAERFIRVAPLGSPGSFGRVIRLKGGAGTISGVHYSADGAGWFVVLRQSDEFYQSSPLRKVNLVYVDRQGAITPIREIPMSSWGIAAPGGKRIAYVDGTLTGNAIVFER
jgi:serine/threonine protein kinase